MSTVTTAPDRPPGWLWREMWRLARLAFPITVSMAAAALILVIDTIMIAPLGTVPLAAASVTISVLTLFYSGIFGFVSAISVRMAEAFGKGSADMLSRATITGLTLAGTTGLVGGLLMWVSFWGLPFIGQPQEVIDIVWGYWITMAIFLVPMAFFYTLKGLFDAVDAPWIGVGLAFLAVLVNVPANWVLIHGIGGWDGFGLVGAGLASILSEGMSLILALIIWRKAHRLAPARAAVARSMSELRVQIREGSTIAAGYVGEGGAYSVAALMMGWFGAVALAANQIVSSVGAVLYMVPMGVSIAVSLRIGQAIGAEERWRLARIGAASLSMIIGWMSLVTVGVLIFGGSFAEALSDDPAVVTLATSMFIVIALMQVVDGIQGTMLGAARGMTDNRVPVVITLVSYWLVALPVGYVLGFELGYGPNGVWVGYGLGLALAAALITWRFFAMARVPPG